jgi:hypothetical protein
MRRHAATALRAFVQLRRMPAMARFACAQSHLRGLAFRDTHGKSLRKAGNQKKTMAL